MKKYLLLTLSLVSVLGLASCNNTDTSEEPNPSGPLTFEEQAIASLRRNNHQATISQTSRITYPATTGSVGLESDRNINVAYAYGEQRAYASSGITENVDIDLTTLEPIESSRREYITNPTRVFEEEGTGLAIMESFKPDNTTSTSYASSYNDDSGVYTPLVFATYFRNPWDYIEPADLTEGNDGKFRLSLDKAEFIIDCYQLTGTNQVSEVVVDLDHTTSAITKLTYSFKQEETATYTRISSLTIDYHDYGEATQIEHLVPYTNDNPELETALHCLDDAESYTYRKVFKDSFSEEIPPNDTIGYFTKDAIFFHQRPDQNPNNFYTAGDEYDYLSKRSPTDHMYYGFYYAADTQTFTPSMLSETQQLVKETFADNGPSFNQLSPAFFKKTGDLTYEAEDGVVSWIGQYFDNGFDGVHSDILATNTLSVEITLTDDKSAIEKVVVGVAMDLGDTTITFTLSDIDNTEIPGFARSAIDSVEVA